MLPRARFEDADWRSVPPHLRDDLKAWLRRGRLSPCYFLNAVLRNDLGAAMRSARIDEWASLHGLVHFLHAECPAEAYGDVESWVEWRAMGGWRGMVGQTEKAQTIYEPWRGRLWPTGKGDDD